MPYKKLPHTADIQILLKSESKEKLFTEALDAMVDIMDPVFESGDSGSKILNLKTDSVDTTTLLIDFLSDVLAESEINNAAFKVEEILKLSDTEIEAELSMKPVQTFNEDVKAVTYHEAEVIQNDDGLWETKITFDV